MTANSRSRFILFSIKAEIMRSALRLWWPSIVFPTFILFSLFPLWWTGDVLAFRDSLHFFYPHFSYIDSLSGFERCVPLWNPWDGLGSSIVAEPTSMIFYPPRWGLLIRFGTIENRIGWFVVGHLVFTYFGWIYCGYRLGWHPLLSQLGAWGYTLSGPVFFQIYNLPYLIGAAWLPFGMLGLWQVLCHKRSSSKRIALKEILALAIPLAMCVLGGDAQTAYHVVMLGSVFIVISWAVNLIHRLFQTGVMRSSNRQVISSLLRLVTASALALGLSAIQVTPTWNWLKHSSRVTGDELFAPSNSSLLASSTQVATAHRESIRNTISKEEPKAKKNSFSESDPMANEARLQFATQPWHCLTLVSPNFFGSFTPIHTRWGQLLPSDGRLWCPSLHVGTSVFILFLFALCSRNRWGKSTFDSINETSSPTTLVGFGSAVSMIALLSSFDFGLYRVWSANLPLYEAFRFPSKWTTFFVWGLCVSVSSLPWSHVASESTICKRWLAWLPFPVASLGGLFLLLHLSIVKIPSVTAFCYAQLQSLPTDRWCGSIDVQATVRNLGFSGLELIIMGLAVSAIASVRFRWGSSAILQSLVLVSVLQLSWHAVSQICFEKSNRLKLAVSNAVQQFEQDENESLSRWHFGDWSCFVVKDLCDTNYGVQISSLAEMQAHSMLGKLHLLAKQSEMPIRNLQADFTFTPRLLANAKNQKKLEGWTHSIFALDGSALSDRSVQFRDVLWDGGEISFRYEADQKCLLELPVFDDGGWRVLHSNSQKVNAPGKLLRVLLENGSETVQLQYATPRMQLGMAISMVSILVVGAGLLLARRM
jgi:hypothetical protein